MAIAAGMGIALSPAASAEDAEEKIKEAVKEKAEEIIKEAEAEGLSTFFGTASPPTSYGGYGGNATEDAKYFFKYPTGWKTDVINKTQKGTQGIDCRVYNPRNKNQQVFVITFSRAGEDNKSFKVTDIENTFAGFAGADYDLQDAIGEATDKRTGERELDGSKYYDVEIDSPTTQYLSTITVASGKVFAMFVKSPTKLWKDDEQKLRNIQSSFRTISRTYARSGPE